MKIILATDGSEFSVEAAKKLGEMITCDDKTVIRIINAVEVIAPPMMPFGREKYLNQEKALQEAAVKTLDETSLILSEALNEKSASIETKSVKGSAKEVILKEAEEWETDLIVVGSHGHGFWDRMFLGSVSNAVVQHAHCTVLVVRKTTK